jgi:hypothetical protein
MKNFRQGKYKGPVVKIRNYDFKFEKEKEKEINREEHLIQKKMDITSPGTNPIKREIFEENYFNKKKKMNVENKYLRGSLESNPYYMKEGSDQEEEIPKVEEGSVNSSKSTERGSKMHETTRGFFERYDLQGTKDLGKYDCWDMDYTPLEWIERCNMYPERTHARCPFYRDGK